MQNLQSFNSQPALIGSSITLRPLLVSDFEKLHAAASDPLEKVLGLLDLSKEMTC